MRLVELWQAAVILDTVLISHASAIYLMALCTKPEVLSLPAVMYFIMGLTIFFF